MKNSHSTIGRLAPANFRLMKACVFALVVASIAADTPATAVKKVREGLQQFRDKKFSDAESSFTEAEQIAPENAIILFDKACAAMAGGDLEQARGLFRSASLSKDPQLTVKAHYNLGCLEADDAQAKLGEDPAAVEGDAREECVETLRTSIRHYRDVLRLEPEHPDARHNLELIRLYIKHLQSQWAERDKQKDRQEKDLLQFLKMIEDRQTQIRSVTKALSGEDGSAYLRQAAMESADSLRTLQEEIEPLKQKITEQIQAAQQGGGPQQGSPAAPSEELQQAEQMLHQAADMIGERLIEAASQLETTEFTSAVVTQTDGLNNTNQLYMTIAPYQDVLQRALKQQQTLAPDAPEDDAAENGEAVEVETTEDIAANVRDDTQLEDDAVVTPPVDVDPEETIEDQTRVTEWSTVLSMKAEAELPQVQQQLDGLRQSMPPAEDGESATETEEPEEEIRINIDPTLQPPAKTPGATIDDELSDEEKAAQAQQQQLEQQLKQLEGMVESMQLAIEKGPSAAEHSTAAVSALAESSLPAAGEEQLETLKILKEIAAPLKSDQQDDQQQNEDQQDQGDQDQENKDQQKDKDGQDNKDQQQQQKPEPKEEDKQQQQKQSDRQRAESMLRQASERERKHREDQKKLRALIMQGTKVERDW